MKSTHPPTASSWGPSSRGARALQDMQREERSRPSVSHCTGGVAHVHTDATCPESECSAARPGNRGERMRLPCRAACVAAMTLLCASLVGAQENMMYCQRVRFKHEAVSTCTEREFEFGRCGRNREEVGLLQPSRPRCCTVRPASGPPSVVLPACCPRCSAGS